MELKDMSVKQLNEVAAKAQELALSKRDSALEALYLHTLAHVQSEGFSLDEVLELHKVKSGKSAKASKTGAKIAPKYRDENGNTWTGRGKTPKWVQAAKDAGIDLDTFLINAPEAPVEAAPVAVEDEAPVIEQELAPVADEAPAHVSHAPKFGQRQELPTDLS